MTTAPPLQPRSHGIFISYPIFPLSLWGVNPGNEVDPRVPYNKQRIHKIIITFLWFKQACSLKSILFDKAFLSVISHEDQFSKTRRGWLPLSPLSIVQFNNFQYCIFLHRRNITYIFFEFPSLEFNFATAVNKLVQLTPSFWTNSRKCRLST